jgi:polysaccharide export outer membrane protein
LAGTVIKRRSRHAPQICFLFAVAFCGGLQSQVAASQQNDGATASTASTAQPNPLAGATRSDETFIIGTDDVLAINVWKEPEFTRSIPVRLDGRISFPLIGDVQAAGRTPIQLEKDIAARLKSYIAHPQVAVIVSQTNNHLQPSKP